MDCHLDLMTDLAAAKTSHDTRIPLHQLPNVIELTQICIKDLSCQN